MIYNLRFNPTACGNLHMGHLYIALVNEKEAHKSGGEFIVRIDDTQRYWIHHIGKKGMAQYASEYRQQLSMFMTIDKWLCQSTMPSLSDIVGETEIGKITPKQKWFYDIIADWIPDKNMPVYPYAPYLTYEKVVWDFYSGVNWIIRGEDLVTEAALYNFYVDMIGITHMKQTYLPRLRASGRGELTGTNINLSKTFTKYILQKQIDLLGVEGVIHWLKKSCLINPDGDFFVDNIKWNPTVVGFTE